MIPLFRVVKAGVYASIQDRGRFGFRRYGMPVAGPMDQQAFQLGQDIMGNAESDNALELFLGGLIVEVLTDHRIIITGADLSAVIDGDEMAPLWKTFAIKQGQLISFTKPLNGAIAYIIPEGGLAAPIIMGSSSSYPRALIGETIKKDMVLYANRLPQQRLNRGLRVGSTPKYTQDITVELFKSPHLELFKPASIDSFTHAIYSYRGGDRMGYFFNGPVLEFINSGDIVSEATQFGTVQVPSNGQPIILMADAQTTGGYATIGTVVKADLPKVAQLKNGGQVRFTYQQ